MSFVIGIVFFAVWIAVQYVTTINRIHEYIFGEPKRWWWMK
jgi:hypothetical protein